MNESDITINGVQLTNAQAMALRVACTAYHQEMASNPDALGDDEHGRRMVAAYRDRLGEVLRLLVAEEGR